MRFGHFDDAQLEYVIERPDTPLPWFNYLGSEAYFGLISNTAGGYSFYRDARLRRLTRYRYNNAPLDTGGRYIYLRDAQSGAYWSPSWQPVRKPLDEYSCRHGLGYTTIAARNDGIAAATTYFVPLGHNLEIWKLSLTNTREIPATFDIFAAVEFCLWDALDDATNYQRNFSIGEVEVENQVIYHKSEYRERRDHFAYFTSSENWAGYDSQREDFLGPYRGWEQPLAVERGTCANSLAMGWAPVGVQQIHIELQPGETRDVVFLLGYQENPRNEKFGTDGKLNKSLAQATIQKFLQPGVVDRSFAELKDYWRDMLSKFQVNTPDEHTNRMVNIWNTYQCMVTFNMSRSASGFETGVGRGMGFRDSAQDLVGFVHLVPKRARERLLDLASTQLESGGAYHQYQPLTKRGNDGVGSNFNDDPLWLVLGAAAYLRETGDWSVLEENVDYNNQPELAAPMLDHLERSIGYVLARRGPHGLPLIGRADWNDCLNLNCFSDEPGQSFQTTTNKEGKVAESVMIAGLFLQACQVMEEIFIKRGDIGKREFYTRAREDMEKVILESGWDGAWFRRAYNDYGKPIGSSECDEGKIFIESQGMCIMGGVGLEDGKAGLALDSANQWLATPHGLVVNQPAYTRYYLELGEISSYPPGYKENASVFCHTNPWIMISEAMVKNGNRAFDYYSRINPSRREQISEVHRCEPYVYAQMIAGKDAVKPGEAKNSWLTGTAAWNFAAITQWILGIRPTFTGLQIDPCLPDDWKEFSATRVFQGCTYQIHVQVVSKEKQIRIKANGEVLPGNVIPLPKTDERLVNVEVTIG